MLSETPVPIAPAALSPVWLGTAHPPAWLAPVTVCTEPPPGARVVLTDGGIDAVSALREALPDAVVVAVRLGATPAEERTLLEAGATLVLRGDDPETERVRLSAVARGRRTSARVRALELAVQLLDRAHDEEGFITDLVALLARELGCERVSLMQLDAETQMLHMRAAVGIPAEVVAQARVALGEGIAGTVAAVGRPIYVDDHARVRAEGLTPLQLSRTNRPGLPVSLTVPICHQGAVVGVVNATGRLDGRPFNGRDLQLVDALTREAGFLLENARLVSGLRRLEKFNQRVVDAIGDPLAVVDAEGRITATNLVFRQRFQGRTGDGLGVVLKLDAERAGALSLLVAGAEVGLDARGAWPLGEAVYDVNVAVLPSDGQRLSLVVLRDVTDRVDRERRLMNAEKMASVGVLAAGVAHEINNPLAYVKANTRHTREYLDDILAVLDAWRSGNRAAALAKELEVGLSDLREDLIQMGRETLGGIERVERIVIGLKSFAHPDTQSTQATEVSRLIESSVLLTQGKWRRALDLRTVLAADLPTLNCLPTQLEQVFMNLVVNAAQAAPGPRNHLLITGERTAQGVRLSFTDDCGGIPDAVRGRIFEPFFTTKDIGEGTGLGLAISQNIVAAHGGTLTVDSTPGQGTTFTIDLPLGEAGRPLVVKQLSRYRA